MKYNEFYGSKLNTALLLILIVLMIIAIKMMWMQKETYLPFLGESQKTEKQNFFITGDKEDLISFSIVPGQEVSGEIVATGILKGSYFFEANVPVSIFDASKKKLKGFPGQATENWMTAEPISFKVLLDFSSVPKGLNYISISPDDPSGGEGDVVQRQILIPVVVK